MITIIDYGLGNVLAFSESYQRLGIQVTIAKCAADLKNTKKLVLPGVGAFDLAMRLFQKSGMREVVDDLVLEKKIPIIGVCVGMQMMADSSEEGSLNGLGWIPGRVRRFNQIGLRLPHMGWNDMKSIQKTPLFEGLEKNPRFYFLHSYYFECENENHILSTSFYADDFSCAINKSNIYGVQFHPEKSHSNGVRLLKNFSEI